MPADAGRVALDQPAVLAYAADQAPLRGPVGWRQLNVVGSCYDARRRVNRGEGDGRRRRRGRRLGGVPPDILPGRDRGRGRRAIRGSAWSAHHGAGRGTRAERCRPQDGERVATDVMRQRRHGTAGRGVGRVRRAQPEDRLLDGLAAIQQRDLIVAVGQRQGFDVRDERRLVARPGVRQARRAARLVQPSRESTDRAVALWAMALISGGSRLDHFRSPPGSLVPPARAS